MCACGLKGPGSLCGYHERQAQMAREDSDYARAMAALGPNEHVGRLGLLLRVQMELASGRWP